MEESRNFLLFFLMTELICLIESLLGRTVGWCVGRLLFLSCTVVVVEEGRWLLFAAAVGLLRLLAVIETIMFDGLRELLRLRKLELRVTFIP